MRTEISFTNAKKSVCTILLLWIGVVTPCLAEEATEEANRFQLFVKEFEKEQADWRKGYDTELSADEEIDRYESWPGWPFIARVEKLTYFRASPN